MLPISVPLVTTLALAVGGGLGFATGVLQADDNRYAALGLLHTRAALLWDCVRAGALLGAVAGGAAACAWEAVRPAGGGLARRLVWSAACGIALVALWTAADAMLLGPGLHASRILRAVEAWIGIGVAVAALTLPWADRVGRKAGVALVLLAIAPLAVARLDLARTTPPATPKRPNVVIVLLDALRADHLDAYGYPRDTSPFVRALADDGILFEHAFSPANTTRMSVPSFLGSVPPAAHGIRRRDDQASPALLLLPEVLRDAGYQTAAWMPNPSLDQRYRFYYGFDAYYDGAQILIAADDASRPPHERWETAQRIQTSALAWLRRRDPARPVFLYLHYRDIHGPYAPPPPYDTRYTPPAPAQPFPRGIFRQPGLGYLKLPNHRNDVGFYVAQYDGAIRYTSDQLTTFFATLRAEGLLDDTLVILMADHGEAFLEHGTLTHGDVLFDELVHVPLVIRTPDGVPRGRRVPDLVGLIDVAPTVLDYVGIRPPASFRGRSLRPLIEGTAQDDPNVVFLEAPDALAIRTSRWKVIVDRTTGAARLFDLARDPGEQRPVAEAAWPAEARALEARLREHVAAHAASHVAGGASPLTPAQRRKLEALGYVE